MECCLQIYFLLLDWMMASSISSLLSDHTNSFACVGCGNSSLTILFWSLLSLTRNCRFILRYSSSFVSDRTFVARFVPYTSSMASARSRMNYSRFSLAFSLSCLYLFIALLRSCRISSVEKLGSAIKPHFLDIRLISLVLTRTPRLLLSIRFQK